MDVAVVKEDLACVGCGYNLRTLSEEGLCPECGEAVARAVRLEREHGRRVRRPGWVVMGTLAAALVHGVLLLEPLAGLASRRPGRAGWALYDRLLACRQLLEAVLTVAAIALLWNAGLERRRTQGQQVGAWLWLAAAVGTECVKLVIAAMLWDAGEQISTGLPRSGMAGWQAMAWLLADLGVLVVLLGAWRYVRAMARARRDNVVAWMAGVMGATGALYLGGELLEQVVSIGWWLSAPGTRPPTFMGRFSMGAGLVGCLWNLAGLVVFWPLVGRMGWRARGGGKWAGDCSVWMVHSSFGVVRRESNEVALRRR